MKLGDAISSRASGTSPSSTAGFVALFAVLISAIVLTITLGIANISYKEVLLTSQARDANFAFFAADTGAECALYADIQKNGFGQYDSSSDSVGAPDSDFECAGTTQDFTRGGTLDFYLPFQSSPTVNSCAHVTVDKNAPIDSDNDGTPESFTKIESLGYNATCTDIQNLGSATNLRIVERAIRVTYPN